MKSRLTFSFFLVFVFGTISLNAQHLNCDSIQLEDIICDFDVLDGYTGTLNTEDSGGVQPDPLCNGGGEADNIIWFGFIAPVGEYEILLSFENCESGMVEYYTGPGIQLGVYTDCSFTESVFCAMEYADTLSKVIPSSLFQPGQDYFLFIDGFAEAVCDYEINIIGTYENNTGLSGITFVDYNADGIQNKFEPELENVTISLDPGELTTFSDSVGYFSFENIPEGSYTLTATAPEGEWVEEVIVIETAVQNICSHIAVGFQICTSDTSEISVNICDGENYLGYYSTGIYTVVEPNGFGCDSATIINLTVIEPSISDQELEVCAGDTVLINNTEYIFSESVEIIDTMFDSNGCISNLTVFEIMVNPTQMISIDTTICEGMSYLGFTESGEYSLDSINVEGCMDLYSLQLTVLPLSDPLCVVGVESLPENEFIIYPNPARDQFFIEGENIETITIYFMDYQSVREKVSTKGSKIHEFSTANLIQGLYIIAIKSEGKIFYNKLIVE